MNSGLQCLSHTMDLTKYILENKYKKDINLTNPHGSKGLIIKSYANFIKNVWYGSSTVFSPWGIKNAISEYHYLVIIFLFIKFYGF